jgi:hypothetical protein
VTGGEHSTNADAQSSFPLKILCRNLRSLTG